MADNNTRVLNIRAQITGDDAVVQKINKIGAAGDKAVGQLSAIDMHTKWLLALDVFDRVQVVVGKLGKGFQELVRLGHESTLGQRGLLFGLGPQGLAEVNRFVDEMVVLANVMDGELYAALDKVQSKTNANAAELKLAGRAIIGLAGDTKNYDAAAEKVIKTMNHSGRVLKDYGVQLDKSATGHERLNALVEATQTEFDKQISKANNATDQFEILHTQIENVVGSVGALIDQSPPVVTALKDINEVVSDLVKNFATWIEQNPVLIQQLGKSLAITLLTTAKAAAGLAQTMNYLGEAWTYLRPFNVTPGPRGAAEMSHRFGEIGTRMQAHNELEEILRQVQDQFDISIAAIAGGQFVSTGASGGGGGGFGGGLSIPGKAGKDKAPPNWNGAVSGWSDELGGTLFNAVHDITLSILHPLLRPLDGSDPILSARRIMGLPLPGMPYLGSTAGASISGRMNSRNGLIRLGNLSLEESMFRVYGGPQIERNQEQRSMTYDFETGQWVNTGDPNFNRRSIGHKGNLLGYLGAAREGDLSGLLGMAGGVYGAGWGVAGGLLGSGLKRLFGGGGGKDPEVVAGKVQVYDQQVHETLKELQAELLNSTLALQARGLAAGIDSSAAQLGLARQRGGSPAGRLG